MCCLRREVFKSENIVFSGLIPYGIDPKTHEYYYLCNQYGGTFQDHITETTTVVVARIDGTE